ncbi:cyclin-dependent kinase inhibitor 7 [Coffea arabica]|uniref:Cyclin-dependent kinase inhibitor n=1 Tax=Coffea arabica TaxID=13443 RepID=A0A6P6VS76_COFAR|nr:cyclin-dependent kinase inhibitor 7 [Coffea arabica]
MGDYLRKCERSIGEMAAAAATEIGGEIIKMRAVEEEEEVTSSSKRRKVDDCDEAPEPQLNLPAYTVSASAANSTTTSSAANVHEEKMRSTDLKHQDSETEISTLIIRQFRETSPSSEICGGDSGIELMESISSTTTKKEESSRRNRQELKTKTCMPSAAEIEEFFAVAEKRQQKQFAEKYNYDIVKDVPLEGRYEWVRLKP